MPRLSLEKMNPEGYQAIRRMDAHTRSTVGSELLELIKIRASILNGCGYCVDNAHDGSRVTGDPRAETARRRRLGTCRRAVRREGAGRARPHGRRHPDLRRLLSDDVWARAKQHFSDEELGDLLLAVGTINVWNRIAIAAEVTPPIDAQHPVE